MKYTFIVVNPNKKNAPVDKSEVNDPSQSACTNTNNNSSSSNVLVTYSTDKSVKFRNMTSQSLGGTFTPISAATNLMTHNQVANPNTLDTNLNTHNNSDILVKIEADTLDNKANNHNNNVNTLEANSSNEDSSALNNITNTHNSTLSSASLEDTTISTPPNNITNCNTFNNTVGQSSKSNYTNALVPRLNTTPNYVPIESVDGRPFVWTVGAIWTL